MRTGQIFKKVIKSNAIKFRNQIDKDLIKSYKNKLKRVC